MGEGVTLHCVEQPSPCPKDYAAQLDTIEAGIRHSNRRRVLVRIHGGLNSLASSFDATDVMLQRIAADTNDSSAAVYPIFVNWESGLKSAYLEHLFYITQGQRYNSAGRLAVSPVYLAADIGKGLTRALFTWGQHVTNFRNAHRTEPDSLVADDAGILRSEGGYRPTRWQRIGFTGFGVLLTPLKAVEIVFVDAFGTPAWDNMHRRTKVLFRDPNEFVHDRHRKTTLCDTASSSTCETESFTPATGALSLLLDRLQRLTQADTTLRVTLIGHSMGAIVADEIVRTRDSIPFDNIVFLAAASSVREFELGVAPYLARHPHTQFYNVTLHPSADLREQTMFGLGPNGSLLEWLDAYFTNPGTDLDRMMGKYANVREAEHIFAPGIRSQIHIKAFGYRDGLGCGAESEPHHHGGFNDASVPFWRKGIWEPGLRPCASFDSTSHAWSAPQ
jgi:pimeloyl-ACP methyl ester carboxylesterase